MKKNYLIGFIGSLIGGLIATIPWILLYVYANMIYSLLALVVAVGALKGYELFKGKIDKKLPIIIIISSLLSITIATLIIIPSLLLIKEGFTFRLDNLEFLYSNSDFTSAIMKDYITSILFTCLGISGVISSIKTQVASGKTDNIKIDLLNGNNKKEIEKIKNIFYEKNALSKENAIKVDELDYNEKTFELLLSNKTIVKEEDKYYYSVEREEKIKRNNKNIIIITILIVLACFIAIGYLSSQNNTNKPNTNYIKNNGELLTIKKDAIKFDISKNYIEEKMEDEEFGWYYMPKEDISGYSGHIGIYYFDENIKYSNEWAAFIKKYFETEENGTIEDQKHFKTKNNLEVMLYKVKFKDDEEYTDYIYYIFGKSKMCIVEAIDFYKDNNIAKDAENIVESLTWINEI